MTTAPTTGPLSEGMSLALPRAGSLTDALMAPSTETVSAAELRRLRDRLAGDLAALVEELPAGEKLRLDEFRFGQARRRPERLSTPDGPFVASPATSRRAVGLGAVARCLRGRAPSPGAAVAEVLADGVEDAAEGGDPESRPPWWAAWYAGLGSGGQAMVEAEAVTWATQLWTALEWDRATQAVVGGPDDWWDCPGTRALTLRGRADVRMRAQGRPVLLVVGSGVPPADWRSALGFPALVPALARGEKAVPARVVGLWPASGQVRILPVDDGVLLDTATAVIRAVSTWVDARREIRAAGAA
jgi:hypothetical protein